MLHLNVAAKYTSNQFGKKKANKLTVETNFNPHNENTERTNR